MQTHTVKHRATLLILALAASALNPAPAAENDSPYGALSATLKMESDYRFRGISQNDREPTPEMSVDWSGFHGFYAGTSLEKINFGDDNASFESDYYAGKHTDLGYDTDLNTKLAYYSYPDANYSEIASFMEVIGQLSHSFDRLSLTATGAYTPQWSSHAGTGWAGAGTAAYAFTSWLSISGTFGHQWVKTKPDGHSYWDMGVTALYRGFTLDVRYKDTNLSKSKCASYWMGTKKACDAGLDVTVSYNIAPLFDRD